MNESVYDELDVQYMFKKLDMEFQKQSLNRNLAEQVLSWYIAVAVLVTSILGAVWNLSTPGQELYLFTSVASVCLGIFGALISLRIFCFIIDYDIQQKIIDRICIYFIINNTNLLKYHLKTSDWPVKYKAFNPMNTVFFITFSMFNVSLVALGSGFSVFYVLDWLIFAGFQLSYTNRILLCVAVSASIAIIMICGDLWIFQKLNRSVNGLFEDELKVLDDEMHSRLQSRKKQ